MRKQKENEITLLKKPPRSQFKSFTQTQQHMVLLENQRLSILDDALEDIDVKMKRFQADHPERKNQFYFFYWLALMRQFKEQQYNKKHSFAFHNTTNNEVPHYNQFNKSGIEFIFILLAIMLFLWKILGLLVFGSFHRRKR